MHMTQALAWSGVCWLLLWMFVEVSLYKWGYTWHKVNSMRPPTNNEPQRAQNTNTHFGSGICWYIHKSEKKVCLQNLSCLVGYANILNCVTKMMPVIEILLVYYITIQRESLNIVPYSSVKPFFGLTCWHCFVHSLLSLNLQFHIFPRCHALNFLFP